MSRMRGVPKWIVTFGALAELLFGYDVGIIAVALLSVSEEFALGPAEQGTVVSALLLGAAVGVAVGGRLADRIGRRPALALCALVFAVGGAGAAAVADVEQLIAARFVIGLAVGASAVVVSVYLVEIAPAGERGAVGAMGQLMVAIGILLSYLVGYALEPSGAWRWMFGLSVVPALVLGVGVWFLPESPRHLLLRGRTRSAEASLRRLRHGRLDATELDAMAAALTPTRPRVSLRARSQLRRTTAGFGLAVLVQLLGVNAIAYFAPTTLVRAGFSEHGAVAANLSIGVIGLACTLVGVAIMDRVERRRLLMTGCVGASAAMTGLAAVNAFLSPSTTTALATLACMLVFLAAFATTWGVSLRIVVSELFPSEIRASAVGVALSLNWLTNFAVAKAFPSLLATHAVACFLAFAAVGGFAFWFVARVVPETGGGRTLEQVSAAARN